MIDSTEDRTLLDDITARMFLLDQRMCKLEEIILQLTVESRGRSMDWVNFKPGGTD